MGKYPHAHNKGPQMHLVKFGFHSLLCPTLLHAGPLKELKSRHFRKKVFRRAVGTVMENEVKDVENDESVLP